MTAAIGVSTMDELSGVLPDKVALPGSQSYAESIKSYFTAQQAALRPQAIVRPTDAQDVVTFIKTATKLHIPFAIRGGGHSPYAGTSNIESGVTVDMRDIVDISVNEDKSTVSVGAGAFWGHVYEKLEPLDRCVAGGHGWNVGIAGFILGGGISPFTPRFGFTCNLVQNFEVVTAAGELLNANAKENSDLWHALKGGLNNFGIVTRFDMTCFPQGKIWGGYVVNPATSEEQNLTAFSQLAPDWDPYANVEQSYTFSPARGGLTVVNSMEYTKEVENPDVLKPFTDIKPAYRNTMRIASISEIAKENQSLQANGSRQIFSTTSFFLDFEHLKAVLDLYKITLPAVKEIKDVRWTLTFRRLHANINSMRKTHNGDSTAVGNLSRPLVVCVLTYSWSSPSDDQLNEKIAREFMAGVDTLSRQRGLFHAFQYLNYAAAWQTPLAGFDVDTKKLLQEVSKKYDPSGVFQTLVPGGFKLWQ